MQARKFFVGSAEPLVRISVGLIGLHGIIKLVVLTSCAVALFAGVMSIIEIVDRPGLRLEGGLAPGWILSLGFALSVTGFLATIALGGRAFLIVLNTGRSFRSRALGLVPHIIRGFVFGLLSGALLIGALNAIDGNRYYLVLDDATVRGSGFALALLEKAVSAFRAADEQGLEVHFDTDEIEAHIRKASAEGITQSRAMELWRAIEGLKRVNDRLGVISEELATRGFDTVEVFSAHGGPDATITNWPLDPQRTYCNWDTSARGQAEVPKASIDRIIAHEITTDPSYESVGIVELEVPTGEFPELHVELLDGSNVVWSRPFKPPARDSDWVPSPLESGIVYGVVGPRISYQFNLPRIGDSMRMVLNSARWVTETARVPQFSGRAFSIGKRHAVLHTTDPGLTATIAKLGIPDVSTNGPRDDFPPIGITTSPRPDIVSVVSGGTDLLNLPKNPVIELIVSRNPMSSVEAGRVIRAEAFSLSPNAGAWLDSSSADNFADLGLGQSIESGAEVFVRFSSEKGPGHPLIFRRHPRIRPGAVSVVVPRNDDLEALTSIQRDALAFMITWAASLAQRNGDMWPSVAGSMHWAYEETLRAKKTGPSRHEEGLVAQIVEGMLGGLDNHVPSPFANRLRVGPLTASFTGMAILVTAIFPGTLLLTYRTRRAKKACR